MTLKSFAGVVLVALALIALGGLALPVFCQTADADDAGAAASTRTVYRNPQRSPTRERYKQIQQALKDHGYDPGPIDGRWGSKTSAALRRFERDNELPADGRLDSLVLIMLGLGPKRLNSVNGGAVQAVATP